MNIRNENVKLNWKNDKWKQKFKCKKCNLCFINRDRKTLIIKTEKILTKKSYKI